MKFCQKFGMQGFCSVKLNIQKAKIMAAGPGLHGKQMGKQWKQWLTLFFFWGGASKITADGDCSHEIKRLTPWKESFDQPRQHVKKQRHCFANKGLSSQGYGFSSGHVWM